MVEPVADDEQKHKASDAKEGVDQSPEQRDSTNRAEKDGMRKDKKACRDSEGNDPGVRQGIAKGDQEWDGDDEMSEGEPVVAIEKEGIVRGYGD